MKLRKIGIAALGSRAYLSGSSVATEWTQTISETVATAQVGEKLHLNKYCYNYGTASQLNGNVRMWQDSETKYCYHMSSQSLGYGQGLMEESPETVASGSLNQQRTLNNVHYYTYATSGVSRSPSTTTSGAKKFTVINY
jgi:hypothetical protein